MTCPTITTLHAILAAYDAPAGPSKSDTIKAVAECLSGACAAPAADTAALFDVNSPLWAWVNEKNIGRAEYDRRSSEIDAAQSMLSGLSPSCADLAQQFVAEVSTGLVYVGELRAMGQSAADLSAAILNLPCTTPSHYDSAAKVVPYRMGHLDARFAAARLTRQTQPVAAQGEQAALDLLKRARRYVEGAYECAFPDSQTNREMLADIDAILAAKGGA